MEKDFDLVEVKLRAAFRRLARKTRREPGLVSRYGTIEFRDSKGNFGGRRQLRCMFARTPIRADR